MKTLNESKRAFMAAMKQLMKCDDDEMIHYNEMVYQGNGVVMVKYVLDGKERAMFIRTNGNKAQIECSLLL